MSTRTLSPAASYPAGNRLRIHNSSTDDPLTIQPAGADTIQGGAVYVLRPQASVDVESDGVSNWYLTAGNIARPMLWKGYYDPTDPVARYAGDVMLDGGWLAHCMTDGALDRPRPQEIGDPFWLSGLDDTAPGFSDLSENTAYLFVGQRYTLTVPIWGKAVRLWLPDIAGNATQELWIVTNPLTNPAYRQVVAPLTQDGSERWVVIQAGSAPIPAGTVVDAVMIYEAQSTPTVFAADWDQKNGNTSPSATSGEAWFRNNQTEIRFSNWSKSPNVNQRTSLEAVTIGATLEAAGQTWEVTGKNTSNADWVGFDVQPGGIRPAEGEYTYTWTYGSAVPIEYDRIDDHFAGSIQGFQSNVSYEDAILNLNNHAYGVDLQAQQLQLSPNWEIMGYTEEFE